MRPSRRRPPQPADRAVRVRRSRRWSRGAVLKSRNRRRLPRSPATDQSTKAFRKRSTITSASGVGRRPRRTRSLFLGIRNVGLGVDLQPLQKTTFVQLGVELGAVDRSLTEANGLIRTAVGGGQGRPAVHQSGHPVLVAQIDVESVREACEDRISVGGAGEPGFEAPDFFPFGVGDDVATQSRGQELVAPARSEHRTLLLHQAQQHIAHSRV
jgi:hypothetical protein